MLTEDTKVANTLDVCNKTAVNSIDITENKDLLTEIGDIEDPIKISINSVL